MKRTAALISVASVLIEDPEARHYGYELSQNVGIRSGVLYPILRRLHAEGWLEDCWESPPNHEGRPPRRYYELTNEGRLALRAILASATAERVPNLRMTT